MPALKIKPLIVFSLVTVEALKFGIDIKHITGLELVSHCADKLLGKSAVIRWIRAVIVGLPGSSGEDQQGHCPKQGADRLTGQGGQSNTNQQENGCDGKREVACGIQR